MISLEHFLGIPPKRTSGLMFIAVSSLNWPCRYNNETKKFKGFKKAYANSYKLASFHCALANLDVFQLFQRSTLARN